MKGDNLSHLNHTSKKAEFLEIFSPQIFWVSHEILGWNAIPILHQAIAWGSTVLDRSSNIFYRFLPFSCQFSRFTHFCRNLHFVAIYELFPQIFLAEITISATKVLFLDVWSQHPPPTLLPTSYLSFFFHKQDFRKPNFTHTKSQLKTTKTSKNVSEKVKYMQFINLTWKN